MSRSFYFETSSPKIENSSDKIFVNVTTPYRACREINPSHTFNIPPPSPKKKDPENQETPVLILESFQRPPIVTFENVILGNSLVRTFKIVNPADVEQVVEVSKLPKPEDGFTVNCKKLTVCPGETVDIDVTLKPGKIGGVRSKIHLITSFGEKFEVILLGSCIEKAKMTKKRAKTRRRPLTYCIKKKSCMIPLEKDLGSVQDNPSKHVSQRTEDTPTSLNDRGASIISKEREQRKHEAAICIQKNFRGYSARRSFNKIKQAAIIIQKHWRDYCIKKRSAVILHENDVSVEGESQHGSLQIEDTPTSLHDQRTSSILKDQEQRKLEAAICIQKNFRRYSARRYYKEIKRAAIIIQKHWRYYCIEKKSAILSLENDFVSVEGNPSKHESLQIEDISTHDAGANSILKDQEQRKLEAAICIQKNFRRYSARRYYNEIKRAAVIIQKYWRGYRTRKNAIIAPIKSDIICMEESPSEQESLQVKDTPDLPLGFRTYIAHKKLINYRSFCQLQAALSSLETTTKISPESCCKIASASTVHTILEIIKRSNRSEPSKLVCSHAFNVLLNLLKYEKTQDLIISRRIIINICIEKAKNYIKSCKIANKCLTIIYLMIVKSPEREAIISNPKIIKNMMSLIKMESTIIKSNKKHKITKEIIFYPYWSSAKGVFYEFTDRFTALEHINYLFKGTLF